MREEGADGLVVVMKPGNAGGAKRPDDPAEETGQPTVGGAGVGGKALQHCQATGLQSVAAGESQPRCGRGG